jgi:hypothetical protein
MALKSETQRPEHRRKRSRSEAIADHRLIVWMGRNSGRKAIERPRPESFLGALNLGKCW